MNHNASAICLSRYAAWSLLALTGLLMIMPIRVLAANVLSTIATSNLDDNQTESLDLIPVSEETLPAYEKSIGLLEAAASLAPWDSQYQKDLAVMNQRLGIWAGAMEGMGALPHGFITAREAHKRAEQYLEKALALEPTNPDYHLSLGRLYAQHHEKAYDDELRKAVELYPINSAITYSVALQYFLLKENEKALRYARSLAQNDDSYKLEDNTAKRLQREQRRAAHIAFLSDSYLMQSLEIAWRASNKNREIVKSMVPDTPDAQQVLEVFLDAKGLEN